MIIPERIEIVGTNLQPPEKTRERSGGERGEEVLSKDQVTVSERAKDIARLQTEVSNVPEIRADRVQELQNAINTGTYNVRGEAVAGKFIREAIIDSFI
jgi:negative regulator of flagellin synthesis FlgM